MMQFIHSGGPFMYIILGVSFFAAALICERFFVLTFCYTFKSHFFDKVIRSLKHENVRNTVKLCRSTSHPLAVTVTEVIKNIGQSKEIIESAAYVSIQKTIPKIQKRTNYIQMIGNVAMLLGLLGTIQGLIQSFSSLAVMDAASKATALASGISTAMNTTALGLIVAIPCIVSFTILSNKEKAILQKYDEVLSEVIHIVTSDPKINTGNDETVKKAS